MHRRSDPGWLTEMRTCIRCTRTTPRLIAEGAHPLFFEEGNPESDILFVFEAPNQEDTYNPRKGRMTFGEGSDETGKFFDKCLEEELGLRFDVVMITNAVLCLPAREGDKFPVKPSVRKACSGNLRTFIEKVDPLVVVTVGGAALGALKGIERHHLALSKDFGRPHQWFDRVLCPLYHTSMPARNGPKGRRDDNQKADYRKLRRYLEEI